jgi:hypothetical protein
VFSVNPLSGKVFSTTIRLNQCPNTIKPEIQTLIPIPDGYKTTGSVIAEQIRTVDLSGRWWKNTGEVLSSSFVDKVVGILRVIID